ncbi:S8 family peptidase [Salisaeta longa]|uniref:S8 family peptidase n=1 Tax=Salisaeta longa TaxID=503170 RepID=UPI00041D1433|nr:S8 family peptidase [Salisaeta longa]
MGLLLALTLTGCAASRSTAPATTAASSGATAPTAAAPDTTAPAAATAPSAPDSAATPPPAALVPNTAGKAWHLQSGQTSPYPGLNVTGAYALLADRAPKQTVTVAVIDGGVDTAHVDLDDNLWVNSDEVPGNDTDDDKNGYADDVHGWNFIGGPNGQNVNHDTYELTRIYDRLHARFASVDSAAVADSARQAYQRYQEIKATFQKRRSELQTQYNRMQQVNQRAQRAVATLKETTGLDSLSQAAVEGAQPSSQAAQRAKAMLLFLYNQNVSPKQLDDYVTYLHDQLKYGYNPDFNPRPRVGDTYADKTERYYGNPDVTGPDAEHGTHVAGIIGAERDNNEGINGIAPVRIMAIRAVPNGDERDKDVANAIRYAVNNGADIINMSFGKSYSPYKKVVDRAVQYATQHDVLMVHAAGNDGTNIDSTANYPSKYYAGGGQSSTWIEVGASSWKNNGQLAADFSNYSATRVDVFAPGVDIYSTVPGGKYKRNSGTSMAAPTVSGVAALLMAYFPELSAQQVRQIILETATPYASRSVTRPGGKASVSFGKLSVTGSIVNAKAAVKRAQQLTDDS